MKIKRVLLLLLGFSILFILLQIDVIGYISKSKKDEEKGSSEEQSPTPQQTYENIVAFTGVCNHHGVRVFVIDPYILSTVMSNVSDTSAACKYLCGENTITSFGVLGGGSLKYKEVATDLGKVGFTSVKFMSDDPGIKPGGVSNGGHKTAVQQLATHVIYYRGGHSIHLMVFYERGGTPYIWHGPLTWGQWASGDLDEVKLNLTHVPFGVYAGAYEKMEIVKVKMDGVALHAPRYPTLFLKQIPHSRFIDCNHSRAKLFYSKFPEDTRTETFMFRKKVRILLTKAKSTLDQLEVPFWLSSGTCLGWFRQCDVIPYSSDVDLGIFIKDYDARLTPAMTMSGFPLKHILGMAGDSFQMSFMGGDIKLDFFYFYEEEDYMWNGATQVKSGKKYKYIFPKFELCWTEFLGLKVRVPCDTLSYVEANYGHNWFDPVKEWDWKTSAANVEENGQWSKEQLPRVIQLF